MSAAWPPPVASPSFLTSIISFLGLDDARFAPSDWSFERNPFWTTFLLTIVVFPCLFYLTWYLNPSMTKNRLGLSWVMGFYSATLFTIAGLYEVPHLRTIFNAAVDYHPVATSASIVAAPITTVQAAALATSMEAVDLASAAARDICYPILKAGTLALVSTLPSFLRLDSGSYAKYYCFSDFGWYGQSSVSGSGSGSSIVASATALNSSSSKGFPVKAVDLSHAESHARTNSVDAKRDIGADRTQYKDGLLSEGPLSLRHRVFQGQMKRPHLAFSLENYPDDGRIGPHIIAANFQGFLVVDLVLGLIHYRKQLEPFSTVVHHIIYYFIVVHMRAGDMLSVFCICGTPIEASSIFLAFGRMFPHRRTATIERLYLFCFVATRLTYVGLLWHEIFFNYPDKSVAFLYTVTMSLHLYWFVLYIQTQKKFQAKQRRQQLCTVLESLADTARSEYITATVEGVDICAAPGPGPWKDKRPDQSENKATAVVLGEDHQRRLDSLEREHGGAQEI